MPSSAEEVHMKVKAPEQQKSDTESHLRDEPSTPRKNDSAEPDVKEAKTGPQKLPFDVLLRVAEAGGLEASRLLKHTNRDLKEQLQRPGQIRNALLAQGYPSALLPTLSDADAASRLQELVDSERFFSQPTIATPPNLVLSRLQRRGLVCEVEGGAGPRAAWPATYTVHTGATKPCWTRLNVPPHLVQKTVSPDGRWLAFFPQRHQKAEMVVFDAHRPQAEPVFAKTMNSVMHGLPTFSDDSKKISILATTEEGVELATVSLEQEPAGFQTQRFVGELMEEMGLPAFDPHRYAFVFDGDQFLCIDRRGEMPPSKVPMDAAQAYFSQGFFVDAKSQRAICLAGEGESGATIYDLSQQSNTPRSIRLANEPIAFSEGNFLCKAAGPQGPAIQLFDEQGQQKSLPHPLPPGRLAFTSLKGTKALVATDNGPDLQLHLFNLATDQKPVALGDLDEASGYPWPKLADENARHWFKVIDPAGSEGAEKARPARIVVLDTDTLKERVIEAQPGQTNVSNPQFDPFHKQILYLADGKLEKVSYDPT
jgi:hypothetical protein